MALAHRRGAWGERVACVFLEQCGYVCLDRRFRRPGGEIDLVMRRGDLLVMVEVKTRAADALDTPEAWLGHRQVARLRRTARQWLAARPGEPYAAVRLDLVAVTCPDADQGGAVRHFPGVG